ncbi:MAG: TolC family protein, partial [Planctomycetota bacterium]|nr:TolC family protein [Planctomycetota bacterium]
MTRYYLVLLLGGLPFLFSGCATDGRTSLSMAGGDYGSHWAESPRSVLRQHPPMTSPDDDPNLYVIDALDGQLQPRPPREANPLPSQPTQTLPLRSEPVPDSTEPHSITSRRQDLELEPVSDAGLAAVAPEQRADVGRNETEIDGLQTLEDFEAWAMATNPVVFELEAKLQSLRGKLLQVGLRPNPVVGVNGQDINETGGAGMYGIFFGRELVRGNKLQLSRSVVCAEIEVAQQELSEMRQRLETDVRVAFYDLLVAQEKLELANLLDEIGRMAADTSEKLFSAKEVARSAVLQAQMESQNASVVRGQAVNEEQAARRRLAALLGEPDLPEQRIEGDLQKISSLADFEQTYDQLLAESPELSKLFENIQRARQQLKRESVEPIPNVTWQATVQFDTVGETVVSGFQVGFPLPKYNRNQGAIRQAEQEVAMA